MKTKKYKTGLMALLLMAAGAAQAQAASIDLFEYAFHLDGAVYDSSLSGLNSGAFDYGTGLGTITATISGSGSHNFIAYFDHDIDTEANTFFNESGATAGALAAGQSWEIDEPGYSFGNIYDNLTAGALDNSNGVPDSAPDDVSLAMGWAFSLDADDTALVRLTVSTVMPTDGFYLAQIDPDSQAALYLSSSLVIRDGGDNPVPEPATMLLLGSGLTGLYGWRRKKTA